MPKLLKISIFLLSIILLAILAGCDNPAAKKERSGRLPFAVITDDAGRTVALPKKPQRIVAFTGSHLELLAAVDAPLVGRLKTKNAHIPEQYQSLPEVGVVTNINLEQVLALQPDCVIASKGQHDKFVKLLSSAHIPVVLLHTKTFADVEHDLDILGQVTGNQDKVAVYWLN